MQELHAALIALQQMDDDIARTQERIQEFAPQLEALEAPVQSAQRDLEGIRTKLEELRSEVRRLEGNAAQKRARLRKYEERLSRARSPRDEAEVRAEIDLVSRALDADLEDITKTSEQATRSDLKVDDLEKQVGRLKTDIAARQDELVAARTAVEEELALLRDRRENHALRLDQPSRRLYERVRGGKSRLALAPITEEGACGNCFNILPVQEQSVIRRGETLHRCEGCGVILYSP
jgi:uncharacterized protein